MLARCADGVENVGPSLTGLDAASGDGAERATGEAWHVGIEDPAEASLLLARVPVRDGAVATSGSAARGAHIVDPRTGLAATEIVQTTVVGPSLLWTDVWATTLVALGDEAEAWTRTLHGTSGLLVHSGGATYRWVNPV